MSVVGRLHNTAIIVKDVGGAVAIVVAVLAAIPAARDRLYKLIDIQLRSWEDITDQSGEFDPSCAHRIVVGEPIPTPQVDLIPPGTRVDAMMVGTGGLYVPWSPESRISVSKDKKGVLNFSGLPGNPKGGEFLARVERRC